MSKLLFEKFPDPKPEVQNMLGCIPWIGMQPDSFLVLMQDSTFRDSINTARSRPKTAEGVPIEGDTPGGEAAGEEDGEKKGLFRKIFSFNPKKDKENKDKEKPKPADKAKGRKEED